MSNMFSSVFSFLTIIPSGSHTLEDTAKNMHAFPAIGLLMGFVLGMAALGLYYAGVDQIIAAFLRALAAMAAQIDSRNGCDNKPPSMTHCAHKRYARASF